MVWDLSVLQPKLKWGHHCDFDEDFARVRPGPAPTFSCLR